MSTVPPRSVLQPVSQLSRMEGSARRPRRPDEPFSNYGPPPPNKDGPESPAEAGNPKRQTREISSMSADSNYQPVRKKDASSRKKHTFRKIEVGAVIEATGGRYEVTSMIASGGFGDVYIMIHKTTHMNYAMKTEYTACGVDRLKLEVCVLEDCTKAASRCKHFLSCVDKGMTANFKFIIMDLIDKPIDVVRKEVLGCNFSKSTAWQIGMQTLEAIEDIHKLGWLHRDIKPRNFAVGLGWREGLVYMFDFGVARKYRDSEGLHLKPREFVRFVGTVKYASRTCHNLEELGRKDDLESWFYMLVDLFNDAALPWTYQKDVRTIAIAKDLFMREQLALPACLPSNMTLLPRYLRTLTYADEPNYAEIRSFMGKIAVAASISVEDKLDWLGCTQQIVEDADHRPLRKLKLTHEEQAALDKIIMKAADAQKEKLTLATTQNKRNKLAPGTMIGGAGVQSYEVISHLGAGGFGDVYLVEHGDTRKRYAMKTEIFSLNEQMERLRVEIRVLEDCSLSRSIHFLHAVGKGKTGEFKYIVMDLIGKSIDDIRKKVMMCNFSKSTALQLGLQTLEAIEELHKLGWLHRDIKGENFAVGPNERDSIVYMFDFGIARKFLDNEGMHLKARAKANFIGSARWASRACHRKEEQGRKDDLECWLYMLIDFFDDAALPWILYRQFSTIQMAKEIFMQARGDTLAVLTDTSCPIRVVNIIRYLNSLEYANEPSYATIRSELMKMAELERANLAQPFDWAGTMKPVKMCGRILHEEGLDATQLDTLEWNDRNTLNTKSGGLALCSRLANNKVQEDFDRKVLIQWNVQKLKREKAEKAERSIYHSVMAKPGQVLAAANPVKSIFAPFKPKKK